MFDGPIGKIIMFWIFILGALFFARALGFSGDAKTTIIFLVSCALIYVVWVVARALGKRRREEQEYTGPRGKKR